jgi:hypothetical protein
MRISEKIRRMFKKNNKWRVIKDIADKYVEIK